MVDQYPNTHNNEIKLSDFEVAPPPPRPVVIYLKDNHGRMKAADDMFKKELKGAPSDGHIKALEVSFDDNSRVVIEQSVVGPSFGGYRSIKVHAETKDGLKIAISGFGDRPEWGDDGEALPGNFRFSVINPDGTVPSDVEAQTACMDVVEKITGLLES